MYVHAEYTWLELYSGAVKSNLCPPSLRVTTLSSNLLKALID